MGGGGDDEVFFGEEQGVVDQGQTLRPPAPIRR